MNLGHFTRDGSRRIIHTIGICLMLLGFGLQPRSAHADLGLWADLALGRFVKAEKGAEANILADKKETALNLVPLCLARSRLKRYNSLFECIDKLEQRIAAGEGVVGGFLIPDSDIRPLPGMLRAIASLELSKFRDAADTAERALAAVDDKVGSTWGPLPPKSYRVELLTLLGITYALLGNQEKARHNLKLLADLDVSDTQPQKYENIRSVGLARIHMALGEYEMALKRMEKEHEEWVRGLSDLVIGAGEDSVGTIFDLPKLLIVAKAHAALEKIPEAKKSLDALLAHPRIVDQGDIHWIALFERGRLAERLGNQEEAVGFYLRSIEIFERQRSSLTTEASKIGFVGDKQDVYFRAIRALVLSGNNEKAFDLVERAKARALVDMLAEKRQFARRANSQADTQKLLTDLNSADLESHALTGHGDASVAGTLRSLSLARQILHEEAPELASLVSVSSVPLVKLRQRLRADEMLVEYYRQEDALFVFLLDRQHMHVVSLQGKAGELEARISEFRKALQEADDGRIQPLAKALFSELITPVAGHLGQKSLILVPHGALHYLPFAALMGPDGKWLVDTWSYRLLPSASTLLYLPQVSATSSGATLAIGNPDLGRREADLPSAESEARGIAAQSQQSELLLGKQATETRFRSLSSQFHRIHFATHGEFRAEQPLQSGLLLAKDSLNDGRITVGEIYDLQLNADLITLSACETGLGDIRSGDDVVGLTRGFMYAGGRSVVASLWKVADDSTSSLMESFYRNLTGDNKPEALRKAQIETRAKYPSPFYWAAFQVMGGR
ncbi:MAG: CHAT domain-containing protein [Sulfuritalea sp.]|nr:CHAT domain-containing protein [Sulfuritalea sp.]